MDDEAIKKKAEELDNSQLFDVHRWSEYPEVNKAVDHIYQEFKTLPEYSGKQNIQKKHIKVVLLDLYVKHLADPERYVSCSRMKGQYKGRNRYNELHISYITVPVVDALHDLGYIEHHKGHYYREDSRQSHMSRMRATRKLIDLIVNDHHVTPAMIERPPNTECIILRKKDLKTGKNPDIEYDDDDNTRRMRKDLRAYNNLLRRTHVDIPGFSAEGVPSSSGSRLIKLDRTDKFTRRIFNNASWEDGGRFYGCWWQRIPKEWRKQIHIDGSPTVEVDYSGLHIVLLYALEGIDYWKKVGLDTYRIEGYEESKRMRSLLKVVLLDSVNAKSKQSAIKAVRKEINLNKVKYGWVHKERIDIATLIDQFAETHKPIAKYFFSNSGVKLQNLDSQIADTIINEFTKEDIPCLCIHDSFIVPHKHHEKLKKLMEKSFAYEIVSRVKSMESIVPKKEDAHVYNEEHMVNMEQFISSHLKTSPWIQHGQPEGTPDFPDIHYQKRLREHQDRAWEKEYYGDVE